MRPRTTLVLMAGVAFWTIGLAAGQPQAGPLVESGKIAFDGRSATYLIRNLPVSSFPELPAGVVASLNGMGCMIPQTYQARRPENVIHGSLERPGSDDWAVLCSAGGKVSLLVFFASAEDAKPFVLRAATESERLQPHDASGELGFNWGIDPATPSRVHDAQAGNAHRHPLPDHDCVADTTLDRRTVYRLYRNGAWETLETE